MSDSKIKIGIAWTPDLRDYVDFKAITDEYAKAFPDIEFLIIGEDDNYGGIGSAKTFICGSIDFDHVGELCIKSYDVVSKLSAIYSGPYQPFDFLIIFTNQKIVHMPDEAYEYHSRKFAIVTFKGYDTLYEIGKMTSVALRHVIGHFLGVKNHCDTDWCVMSPPSYEHQKNLDFAGDAYADTRCYCHGCMAKIRETIEKY